ncbi:MAG: c-type cytochrome biogenesis protein CcmI/CycH [Planctomycetota bacterium]
MLDTRHDSVTLERRAHAVQSQVAGGRTALALPLGLLVLAGGLLSGCAEKRYYEVSFDGSVTRVDKEGLPLHAPDDPLVVGPEEAHFPGDGHDHGSGSDGDPQALDEGPPTVLLSGVIELPAELGVNAASFDCVFIMARANPEQPMADFVKKIESPSFPLSFEITDRDAMQAHARPTESEGYSIVARLDQDGDAVAQYGDVQGQTAEPARVGGPPTTLRLTQVLGGKTAPTLPPMSAATPTLSGGAPAGAQPPAATGTATTAPAAGPRLKARIELAPVFAANNGKHTLFVIVRSANQGGGMPIAVRRYDLASFPLDIEIGVEHVPLQVDNKAEMLGGTLKLSARLSLAGGAMPAAGDLEGEPVLVQAGGEPATLLLDRARP